MPGGKRKVVLNFDSVWYFAEKLGLSSATEIAEMIPPRRPEEQPSHSTITKIKHGEAILLETAHRVARALQVDLEDLKRPPPTASNQPLPNVSAPLEAVSDIAKTSAVDQGTVSLGSTQSTGSCADTPDGDTVFQDDSSTRASSEQMAGDVTRLSLRVVGVNQRKALLVIATASAALATVLMIANRPHVSDESKTESPRLLPRSFTETDRKRTHDLLGIKLISLSARDRELLIADSEVSQAQFLRHLSDPHNPRAFQLHAEDLFTRFGGAAPACWVNTADVADYLHAINRIADKEQCLPIGWGFRLPTTAEMWAAADEQERRFIKTADQEFEDTTVYRENANVRDRSHYRAEFVRSKRPNRWGLFDLRGNVAELVTEQPSFNLQDASLKTLGGSFNSQPEDCRLDQPSPFVEPHNSIGFRVIAAPRPASSGQ